MPCRWLQDVMAFWQTIASCALSSCHNVFDHRTKGVCLEGLKRRADQVCAGAAAAACIHMHMCCVCMARSGLCQVSVRPDNGLRKCLVNAYTPRREHTETCLRSSGVASVTTPRMRICTRTHCCRHKPPKRDGTCDERPSSESPWIPTNAPLLQFTRTLSRN